jgi:membrane-bound lytic murein transglycosylase D
MLGLTDYYFPMIEEILDMYQLPQELRFLPVIESA